MSAELLQKPKSQYRKVFLICLALSAALFAPHCLYDAVQGGFFHYAGDFNDQQISFYSYANAFVKQGGSFSWATDLGSGFVNAYSFYLVGSPFFWLSLLLPSRLTPWFMVPLLCLKFALAGAGAYRWARRWVRREDSAVLAGCLYAFSGFSIYNIFFNHFLDVVALFPYLLAAFDDAAVDGRRGVLPFWVALNLINNYFFFAGQPVFLILYFLCMCRGKKYRFSPRMLGRMLFESVLGCGLGCVLLIPAGLSLLQNPRTIDPFTGYGFLVYGKAQQYLSILYSGLLMPDAPYLTDLFDEGVFKWTSLSAYLPVVGVAGALAFCRVRRRHPFARLLKVCLVFALVPVLNSAFYALNSSFYARWYYMPVLILCGATVKALENTRAVRTELPSAIGLVTVATLSSIAFAVVPNGTDEEGNPVIGVVDNQLRFWGLLAVTMLGIGLFALVLLRCRRAPQRVIGVLLPVVLGFSFVYGSVHLSITKYGQMSHDSSYVEQTYGEAPTLRTALDNLAGEDGFYRLDAYECYNNMGLWLDRSCIQFFNSTVAPHILEFYPSVGVTRDVNSKPDVSLYALRGLLSVRYTLVPAEKQADWEEEGLLGWHLAERSGSYLIYENENWVPMGLTYEYYISEDEWEEIPEEERGNVLMKAALLDQDQIYRWKDLLEPLPEQQLDAREYTDYVKDCDTRRQGAAASFTATSTGFEARMEGVEEQTLVVFSVPYDDGFSATVNGQPTEILKVDNGLMAVAVPSGDSEITFTYQTPGLRTGIGIAVSSAVLYLAYLMILYRDGKARANDITKKEETKE